MQAGFSYMNTYLKASITWQVLRCPNQLERERLLVQEKGDIRGKSDAPLPQGGWPRGDIQDPLAHGSMTSEENGHVGYTALGILYILALGDGRRWQLFGLHMTVVQGAHHCRC